jgi:hypothetical protein
MKCEGLKDRPLKDPQSSSITPAILDMHTPGGVGIP